MKRALWNLIALNVYLAFSAVSRADEKESYARLFAEVDCPWGPDFKRSDNWKSWEGLSSWQGFEIVLTELTGPGGGPGRLFAFAMLDRMQFPRAEVAARIMNRAKENSGEPFTLKNHFIVLDRFGDEPGVVPFWASWLSDTRSTEIKPRHPESQVGQTVRVCDVAKGCLKRWLEKRKLWMPGDPGYGDPTGGTMWNERNEVIDALNEVLLRNHLITAAVRPDPQAVTPAPPPRPPKDESTPNPQQSLPNPWATRHPPQIEEYRWWPWAIGVIILGGGLACLLLIRRSYLRR